MADEKKATRRPPFLDLIRLFYIIPALQMLIFTASELQNSEERRCWKNFSGKCGIFFREDVGKIFGKMWKWGGRAAII